MPRQGGRDPGQPSLAFLDSPHTRSQAPPSLKKVGALVLETKATKPWCRHAQVRPKPSTPATQRIHLQSLLNTNYGPTQTF